MSGTRDTAYPGVTLRPSQEGDRELLYRVYAASRAEEMALVVGWSDAQKEEFLRFQFTAQDTYYRTHYPDARYDVIVRDGVAVGRFYIERMTHEIRLMDIALLPDYRNQGIGSALVREVLEEAAREGKFVSLHVEEASPAKRLYGRMGFVEAGEVSFYKLMHWIPAGLTPIFADDTPDQLS